MKMNILWSTILRKDVCFPLISMKMCDVKFNVINYQKKYSTVVAF